MKHQCRLPVIFATLSAVVFGSAIPVAAQTALPGQIGDSAQVTVQGATVTPDGRLTFAGHGFAANESTTITVEDDQGNVQARLEPAKVESDGQINMVSVSVPSGLTPGPHILRVAGQTSGRFGRAPFELQWQSPTVHLAAYTGKPTHTFDFSGSGFVPGEQVDVYLSTLNTDLLASVAADSRGEITGRDLPIPRVSPGDYTVSFVGRGSRAAVAVGFNVQGFHPWVVLDNYYVAPQTGVGISGVDFIPGEAVQVYLNSRLNQPVAQVTADADGRFQVKNAFVLPDLSGDNQLIFVGQQSQTEISATLTAASPPPTASSP